MSLLIALGLTATAQNGSQAMRIRAIEIVILHTPLDLLFNDL